MWRARRLTKENGGEAWLDTGIDYVLDQWLMVHLD